MYFEQYAKGTFTIEVEGEFHCGPDNTTPKQFDWEVKVQWPDGSLDGNGFLLDNLTFQAFFDRCGKTALSCELFASNCAKEFMDLCGGRPNWVKVYIWAIKGSVRLSKGLTREEWKQDKQS